MVHRHYLLNTQVSERINNWIFVNLAILLLILWDWHNLFECDRLRVLAHYMRLETYLVNRCWLRVRRNVFFRWLDQWLFVDIIWDINWARCYLLTTFFFLSFYLSLCVNFLLLLYFQLRGILDRVYFLQAYFLLTSLCRRCRSIFIFNEVCADGFVLTICIRYLSRAEIISEVFAQSKFLGLWVVDGLELSLWSDVSVVRVIIRYCILEQDFYIFVY